MATGRSDYPNQVNNALCFPYIFRGALDVGATTINEEMKIACVYAIARMAHIEADAASYGEKSASFGRDYLIPRPLDQRLILEIATCDNPTHVLYKQEPINELEWIVEEQSTKDGFYSYSSNTFVVTDTLLNH
jgi:malic enzyme